MPPSEPKNMIACNWGKGKRKEEINVGDKKMGRPYKDSVKKTGRLEMRTTPQEEEMLQVCCEKTGKSRADILRMGLQKVYMELKN